MLDRLAPGGPSSYTPGDFRVAMSVQYLFWRFGAVQIWRTGTRPSATSGDHPDALVALRDGHSLLPGISQGTNR